MFTLGLAPPPSLGEKLFAATLMVGLVTLLIRTIYKSRFSKKSFSVAFIATAAIVLGLEFVPRSYGLSSSFIAACVGSISAICLLSPVREVTECRESHILNLSAITLLSGFLLGLIVAALTIMLTYVPKLDRIYTLVVYVSIGTFSGFIGAVIVAAVLLFSLRSTSEPK